MSDRLLLALTCRLASDGLFSELFVYNAAIIFVNSTNTNVCVVMSTLLARMFCHDLVCGLMWGEQEKKGKGFLKHALLCQK